MLRNTKKMYVAQTMIYESNAVCFYVMRKLLQVDDSFFIRDNVL